MSFALFSGILFLSGISALLFQTLWLRLSGLAFGNSVWSAALILSSFMAGLALGNLIAARMRKLQVRPLRLYALLELAVGLFGCLIVFGLSSLGAALQPVFRVLWEHQALLHVLRFGVSFLILLVPTTAMGLTLPVLLEDPLLQRHSYARAIGYLYGWNTLGAVTGALLGEFLLVKLFGILGTGVIAAVVNCVAGGAAWFIARGGSDDRVTSSGPTEAAIDDSPWSSRFLLLTSFGSGAVLLCLEVVWFRFLRLYLASSSTAFCIMLAVVLAGIGSGGLAAGFWTRNGRSLRTLLPGIALLAGLVTIWSYVLVPVARMQGAQHDIYLDRWWEIAALSLALMFPASFFSGLLFPSIASAVQKEQDSRIKSTGLITLCNTVGAAVGPLLATFILLPTLGFQKTLLACAITYLVIAVALLPSRRLAASSITTWSFAGLGVAFIATFLFFPYGRDETHFAAARSTFESNGEHLVARREGTSDTLQLLRCDYEKEPLYYRLLFNDFSMSGSTYFGQRYMRLFAYLPLTLLPQATDGLLICYGVGATADALVTNSTLSHVDVVDISREVFEFADIDVSVAHSNPLHDPKVTSHVQDGRFFLQTTERRYDVITGEPPPPKVAGTVALYSEEFFKLLRSRLKPGGIATFWLPIYQLDVPELKSILRAFHNAFPTMAMWGSADEEWIMMGFNSEPVGLTSANLRSVFENSTTAERFRAIGIEVPQQLPALFLMDGDEVERITASAQPLTDFYPKRLGDGPADTDGIHAFASEYMDAKAAARRFRDSPLMSKIWPASAVRALDGLFLVRETRYQSANQKTNMFAELDFYVRGSRLQTPVEEVLRSDPMRVATAEKIAAATPEPATEIVPDLVAGAFARRDFRRAIGLLEQLQSEGRAGPDQLVLLTYAYCLAGEVTKADGTAALYAKAQGPSAFTDWFWAKLHADFGLTPPN